ncbi:hypothetical protein H8959_019502 [Pygathrix nigripes]
MGCMHAPRKGLSQLALPYRRSVPTWLKLTSDDEHTEVLSLPTRALLALMPSGVWDYSLHSQGNSFYQDVEHSTEPTDLRCTTQQSRGRELYPRSCEQRKQRTAKEAKTAASRKSRHTASRK